MEDLLYIWTEFYGCVNELYVKKSNSTYFIRTSCCCGQPLVYKSCPCVLPFPSVHPSALQSRIYCTSSGSTVARGQRVRCELFVVADCASWNLQCHRQRTWWQRGFISRVRLWGLIWFSDSFVNCNPPSCVCRLMILHRAVVFLLRTSAAVKNCCPSSQNICLECVFTFWNVWNASYIDFVCQRSCETELSESNAWCYSLMCWRRIVAVRLPIVT